MIGIDVLLVDDLGYVTTCIWKGPVLAVPRIGEHFCLHKPPVGEPAADKHAGGYVVTKVVHLLAYRPRADVPSVYVHVVREG